jgi:hypothetical protein
MRKILFLLALPLAISFTGCGMFKKNCDCPKFGYSTPKATEAHAKKAAAENLQ